MPKKIFIGGLSVAIATDASLQRLCAPFGKVVSVQLEDDGPAATAGAELRTSGQTPGAIVTFEEDDAGERAVKELNGSVVDGATLTVVPAPDEQR